MHTRRRYACTAEGGRYVQQRAVACTSEGGTHVRKEAGHTYR